MMIEVAPVTFQERVVFCFGVMLLGVAVKETITGAEAVEAGVVVAGVRGGKQARARSKRGIMNSIFFIRTSTFLPSGLSIDLYIACVNRRAKRRIVVKCQAVNSYE